MRIWTKARGEKILRTKGRYIALVYGNVIELWPRWRGQALFEARLTRSEGHGVLDCYGLSRQDMHPGWLDCCDEEIRSYHSGLGVMLRVSKRMGEGLAELACREPLTGTPYQAMEILSTQGWHCSFLSLARAGQWHATSRWPDRDLAQLLPQAFGLCGIFNGPRGAVRFEWHNNGLCAGSDPFVTARLLEVLAQGLSHQQLCDPQRPAQ